ncbi:NFYB/HAP3 family transcription factor subunit [Candidatus Woesearchaeota archaeon]|nr:NFYB/HAP3 family transcription factor subunit [Candidatus Woesearchaeota archaeon]
MKKGLPLAAMERLLRDFTGLRISEGAKAALKMEMERVAEDIAEKAARVAQHAGRKTIKDEDIRLVVKERS